MTTEQQHIIHFLRYDIHFGGLEDDRQQDQLSKLHHQKLVEVFEKIFDEAIGPEEHLQIDRLELELPVLKSDNWSEKLPQQMEAKLVEKVRDARASVHLNITGSPDAADGAGIRLLTGEGKAKENFLHFLRTGMLNWSEAGPGLSVKQCFEEASKQVDPEFDLRLRNLLMKSETALDRFVHQLEPNILQRWLGRSFPGNQVLVSRLYHFLQALDDRKELPASIARNMRYMLQTRFIRFLMSKDGNADLAGFIQPISREFTVAFPSFSKALKMQISKPVLAACGKEFSPFFEMHGATAKEELITKGPQDTVPEDTSGDTASPDESVPAPNAGLILVWPYLRKLFGAAGLLKDKVFKGEEELLLAVFMLHYLATGCTEAEEHHLPVPKILAGMDIGKPVPTSIDIPDNYFIECDQLLESMIKNWSVMKSTSPDGLRKGFLQRQGLLSKKENMWHLRIERMGMDVLLDRLPYPIGIIKLGWLDQMIIVTW